MRISSKRFEKTGKLKKINNCFKIKIIKTSSLLKYKDKITDQSTRKRKKSGSPSNLIVDSVCKTNPKAKRQHSHMLSDTHTHTLTPNVKCWKIQKATCGVLKTACPWCLGWGGPLRPLRYRCCVTAGIKVAHKHTQGDNIHTHAYTIVFQLYADCLSQWTTDPELCWYTHTWNTHCLNRNTSDASEGEHKAHLFNQFNKLPSWDPNQADFFGNWVCSSFQEDVCVWTKQAYF